MIHFYILIIKKSLSPIFFPLICHDMHGPQARIDYNIKNLLRMISLFIGLALI